MKHGMFTLLTNFIFYTGALVLGIIVFIAAIVALLPTIGSFFHTEVQRDLLGNGKRQIEIQGMIHIGQPQYYEQVRRNIEQRLSQGWLVLYEQVIYDGKPEEKHINTMLLWKRLGMNVVFDPEEKRHLYSILAPMFGHDVVMQDNEKLGCVPAPRTINADVTFTQLLANIPEAKDEKPKIEPSEMRRKFDKQPAWIQRRITAVVRFAIGFKKPGTKGVLPEYITTGRERVVLEHVARYPDDNILIVYGDAHREPLEKELAKGPDPYHLIDRTALRAW